MTDTPTTTTDSQDKTSSKSSTKSKSTDQTATSSASADQTTQDQAGAQSADQTQGAESQTPSPGTQSRPAMATPQPPAPGEDAQFPDPPAVNLDQFKLRMAQASAASEEGPVINQYGLELARRVLSELHIASIGGAPASPVAQEAAEQLEGGDADWWNERGKELAQKEFSGLNQRGSLIGAPSDDLGAAETAAGPVQAPAAASGTGTQPNNAQAQPQPADAGARG